MIVPGGRLFRGGNSAFGTITAAGPARVLKVGATVRF